MLCFHLLTPPKPITQWPCTPSINLSLPCLVTSRASVYRLLRKSGGVFVNCVLEQSRVFAHVRRACILDEVESAIMKVTVTFGQTGVVVPCKQGWTVRDLIQQATQRYRKLLEQVRVIERHSVSCVFLFFCLSSFLSFFFF